MARELAPRTKELYWRAKRLLDAHEREMEPTGAVERLDILMEVMRPKSVYIGDDVAQLKTIPTDQAYLMLEDPSSAMVESAILESARRQGRWLGSRNTLGQVADEVAEVIAENLFKKYPTAKKLASAKQKDVIKIIRKIGFFNVKSKNIIETAKIIDKKRKVPKTLKELIELPGVGRKVANCVLVYAFKQDAIPVDIHVHRISNRLGWVKTKTPEKTELALEKLVPRKHWQILNDTFVTHGKTICAPVSPHCSKCPIYKHCKRVGVGKHR